MVMSPSSYRNTSKFSTSTSESDPTWIPLTNLGTMVLNGKITSLNEIFELGLKIKEAEIVKYVSGERITFNQETEVANMDKIKTEEPKVVEGLTEARKKPKNITFKKEEKEEDEGVIKNKKFVKKEKLR